MAMLSPLPVRNGVNATRLRLPGTGPWPTVAAYLLERFGHVDPEGILRRFEQQEIVGLAGQPLHAGTPLGEHEFIWYYRSLPTETRIPFEARILHQDDHLVVVDKPHFLPTTPGGKFIQESALVRLRNHTGIDDLVPMHRLDRATAGVILFAANPATRGAYQTLFERREIRKSYQAVVALEPGAGLETGKVLAAGDVIAEHDSQELEELLERLPMDFENRMSKVKGQLRSVVEEGPANARTHIRLAARGRSTGYFKGLDVALLDLDPLTGKTHQLRVHLASLGLGIINDAFYPRLWDLAPDDYARPLQLLATSIAFTDPLTGSERRFTSELTLSESPRGA
ncbi:pseudouridine synthase [Glutamicibacter sp. MNS18]|uniref:pseudouridine synthase n=1 Tax=Glutamicibacter sp. MNS18 TaxID=2989817 RepID=UPI00223628C3|nr:pseudouridine synthase [Glutamicibacter sp. MNS18]MCW4465825.1 pseudouridine synthase [Glutamicibacter sp. MNS18]